jgi:hypothetical protein
MGLDYPPDIAPAPARRPTVYSGPGWNLAQRVAFRFALVYLVLYILPFPITAAQSLLMNLQGLLAEPDPEATEPPALFKYVITPVSKYVTKPYADFWDEVVLRTGKELFDVEIQYRPIGSGDTTWNYVQVLVFAVFAAAVALVW